MCIYETIDILLAETKSSSEALKLLRKLWVANYHHLTYSEKVILTTFIIRARELSEESRCVNI